MTLDDREKEARQLLHDVLCQIRLLAGRQVDEVSRKQIFDLADAAHNLPLALAQPSYRLMLGQEMAMTEELVNRCRSCASDTTLGKRAS